MGLTLVAFGTSLPDFWMSIAVARGYEDAHGGAAGGGTDDGGAVDGAATAANGTAEAEGDEGGDSGITVVDESRDGSSGSGAPDASATGAQPKQKTHADQGQMAFSNILGSNIFDLLFGLGACPPGVAAVTRRARPPLPIRVFLSLTLLLFSLVRTRFWTTSTTYYQVSHGSFTELRTRAKAELR